MRKDDLNSKLRDYVVNQLSPTEMERHFISRIYDSFKSLLNNACIQVGSYPRYTSIRPLHDLDIIFILGNWDDKNHNPEQSLLSLQRRIEIEYQNPTRYRIEISLQTHSVTVIYSNEKEEIFSVDIVPGYIFSKNEFKDDTYKVPEILNHHHGKTRTEYYKSLSITRKEMAWINSDPRGYIEIAKHVNNHNKDFRKAVKFIKAWKNSCKEKDDEFKLKSFHIEQVITNYFISNPEFDIFDSIFKFFVSLPEIIRAPQIRDRADSSKYIDDYLSTLSEIQKIKIKEARDCLLIKLEEFTEVSSITELLKGCYYRRHSTQEQFLFDYNIPTFLDSSYAFEISGEAKDGDGYQKKLLTGVGTIEKNRHIEFFISSRRPPVDYYKWKVKNSNSSEQPRGEITDHQTLSKLERTLYIGDHYVECYAIKNETCVAKARQNVKIVNPY